MFNVMSHVDGLRIARSIITNLCIMLYCYFLNMINSCLRVERVKQIHQFGTRSVVLGSVCGRDTPGSRIISMTESIQIVISIVRFEHASLLLC